MESFSLFFWQEFIKTNMNFTEACVIKEAISSNLMVKLNSGVMQVLKNRLDLKDIDNGFRVYIEGVEQNDDYLEKLCLEPPKESEDITSYTSRIFDKKFGIIINGGEKHSELICNNILNAIKPLIDLKGMPPLGLEITIFIGNYGWTPLGIHQDHRGENVIHFHLGPGGKRMYTWEEEKYKELTNLKYNNTDIEPILEHAKEFSFEAGDLYYMPWNKFHVGNTEELSVGITLWFNNPSKYKYFNKILDFFVSQSVKRDLNIIENKFNLIEGSGNSFRDILDILQLENDILSSSVVDFIRFTTNEFNYNLISNGGWQTIPLSQKHKIGFETDKRYLTLKGKKIQAPNNLFKILYKKKNDLLYIYVRGSRFQMQYFTDLEELINLINEEKVIDIDEYLKSSKVNIPQEAILYFLALVYDKRGIELLN